MILRNNYYIMSIISFPSKLLMVTLSVSLFACQQSVKEKPLQPNIVLIVADDLGWSDLGCYGSEIHTPNIDELAEKGMRFTQFHNAAKCFPSRASLITGLYAQDCGYAKSPNGSLKNAITFGELLQSAGYLTYWSGKHHGKDNPFDRGFDHYFGLKDGASNHFNPGRQRDGEPSPAQKRNNRAWCIDGKVYKPYTPESKDFYTTDTFTDYAISYVKGAKELNKPFFLYLAYTAPHDPLMAWPEDISKYQGRYDLGYEQIRQNRYQKQRSLGLIDSTYILSEPAYRDWGKLTEAEKTYESSKMEVYAAMIDRMDQNVGRLIRALEELGLDENTLILFMSDNGASAEVVELENDNDSAVVGSMERWVSLGEDWANVSNTPFRYYKNYSYEGGINTPMIAYWPNKIESGSVSNFVGHFIDVMPTLKEISGASYPEAVNNVRITPLRGVSLLSSFHGEQKQRAESIFWQYGNGQAARQGDWKIVSHGKNIAWELYNLKVDPTETYNLSTDSLRLVENMQKSYNEWYNQYQTE